MILSKNDATWIEAIENSANRRQLSLPMLVANSMGTVVWRGSSTSRRVTLRKSLRPRADPLSQRVIWGFWDSDYNVGPVAIVTESDRPTEFAADTYLSLIHEWLQDVVGEEKLLTDLRVAGKVLEPANIPDLQESITWIGIDQQFRVEVRQTEWRLISRDRNLTRYQDFEGTGGDWLPIQYLNSFCEWLDDHWHEIAFGTDLRSAEARDASASACRAFDVAKLRQQNDVRSDALNRWWKAHAVRASESQLPNLFIERQGDELAFSWDSSPTSDKRSYPIGEGTEFIPVSAAVPALRGLIARHNRLTGAANVAASEEGLMAESKVALGILREYHSTESLSREWLVKRGLTADMLSEFARIGYSRHPVVGLLRSSRSSQITLDDLKGVLECLQPATPDSFVPLRQIAAGLDASIDPREPWRSGYRLARSISERLNIPSNSLVDIETVVRQLGVLIINLSLDDANVPGACIGSPQYVSTIIVNETSPDASGVSGRRTTLAHELCHILFDRSRMRGLAQFEGPVGEADRLLEMRANAFAIELLVPMVELINQEGGVMSDAELRRLSEIKQVSMHALIWHAGNIRHSTMF